MGESTYALLADLLWDILPWENLPTYCGIICCGIFTVG